MTVYISKGILHFIISVNIFPEITVLISCSLSHLIAKLSQLNNEIEEE